MKSILEQAVVCLLNEEHDKANALMHRFMLARARQIHESLREGDDSVLDETWNEELSEEYFSEDDLSGMEGGEADDLEDAGDDLADADVEMHDADADMGAAAADEFAADDLEVDADADVDGDVDSEALGDIRDQLADLQSQIDELLNGGDDIDASALPSDEPVDSEAAIDGMDDLGDEPMDADAPVDGENEEVHEGEEKDEDEDAESDFADIAESITSDLAKITADLSKDGVELGGKSFEQNKKSSLGGKKADAAEAKPVPVKSTNHTGFEREQAPATKMQKKTRNANASADAGRSTVSKEGDKGSLLNKDFAGGK